MTVPRIPLSDAHPGDVLANPATASSGMLLLPAGTELTEKHLTRLSNAGVAEVAVRRTDNDTRQQRASTRAGLEERFVGHEGDTVMMALKAALLAQAEQSGS